MGSIFKMQLYVKNRSELPSSTVLHGVSLRVAYDENSCRLHVQHQVRIATVAK